MNTAATLTASPAATLAARRARRFLSEPNVRVFLPARAHEAGIFRARSGSAELLGRVSVQGTDVLIDEGALLPVRTTKAGRLYRAVAPKDRVRRPRTARQHRNVAWQAADLAFSADHQHTKAPSPSVGAESPIGWLARRKGANGTPFLTRDEVAAAERLRTDFERSQLAPSVSQDWKRFLTSGVQGGIRISAQERDVDGGAEAARERLADALGALGPGLSDVALRVCCFLEGIEAIETSMHWSRRSGKVVLKIALQRLAAFYEDVSVRSRADIETWSVRETFSEQEPLPDKRSERRSGKGDDVGSCQKRKDIPKGRDEDSGR